MARWHTDPGVGPRLVSRVPTGEVDAVAALWHDGQVLVATANRAHDECRAGETHDCAPAVRGWDARSGNLLRTILRAVGDDPAVALALLDGRPQALLADWTEPIRRWDLDTGESAEVVQPGEPVVDLVVDEVDGRATLLLRGFRGTVEWWDVAAAEPGRESSAELLGYPHSLAHLDSDLVTVTGESDGRVVVRDVRTGEVRCAVTVAGPL